MRLQILLRTYTDLHNCPELPCSVLWQMDMALQEKEIGKTAALVRTMKVMALGMDGGNSFMEDYTYHFSPKGDRVLGSHMLEICPSLTSKEVRCEIHPLGIGGKDDPVRLVFNASEGKALNASVIDMGGRMRMLVNQVVALTPEADLPHLPTARVLWEPMPNLKTAAQAWILAGGAHHTCYSQNITVEYLEDYCEMLDIELVLIDKNTEISAFKELLKRSDVIHKYQ